MAAYRRISVRIFRSRTVCSAAAKSLQIVLFRYLLGLEIGLIAMQKVVGSNPISRFLEMPCTWAGRVRRGSPIRDRTIPAFRSHFEH